MIAVSDEDPYLDRKSLDDIIKDLAVEPFNKCRWEKCLWTFAEKVDHSILAKMSRAVLKKYACTDDELLSERVSYLVDDIETFLSMSSAASMYVFFSKASFLSPSFVLSLCLISLEYNRQTQLRKEKISSKTRRRQTTTKRNRRFNWMRILTNVPRRMISSRKLSVPVNRN